MNYIDELCYDTDEKMYTQAQVISIYQKHGCIKPATEMAINGLEAKAEYTESEVMASLGY